MELLNECIKNKYNVSKELNVSPGTVKRWIELNSVPPQYTFELKKLLSHDIDYNAYSCSQKDQFFTPKKMTSVCWNIFLNQTGVNIDDYIFIEPSAGDGSFLDVLPNNTIALDIEPRHKNILKQDFLEWKPKDENKNYIVFGNPPFGLRGHLALKFINHAHTFADYVCFILPQLFESDGKGSPRKRVQGFNLVYSEKMTDIFHSPDETQTKINCVFQIWSKSDTCSRVKTKTYDNIPMKVYSLSDGGTVSSTRNKKMIGKCHIYLPSTCFGKENMKTYNSFEDLPSRRGYGIVFHEDIERFTEKAKNIDWGLVSFLSTNSAHNLRTSIILEQFLSCNI